MTLADVAFWIAAISVVGIADAGVTLEQTSTFLQAARSDLTCDAVVLRSGRSVLYGTASVYDSDDKLATHHALTYLRSSASPS
jgi:acyl-coenzyme A thioesterase PaaI-like protein